MNYRPDQQLSEDKKAKPNPAKATPLTTEKSDIEELKGIVQQLVNKPDRYVRESQQTSDSYRGYHQGYRGTYRPPRQNYQSRQQTPQQSSTQQLNSNTPVISITLFTKNFNVLDVDSMDTIREDVL